MNAPLPITATTSFVIGLALGAAAIHVDHQEYGRALLLVFLTVAITLLYAGIHWLEGAFKQ